MTFNADRIQVLNRELARSFADKALFGEAFLFLPAGSMNQSGFDWLKTLVGQETLKQNKIIPLVGDQARELPGLSIQTTTLPQLSLTSVTSDRELYRAGDDDTHLLVVSLNSDKQVRLTVLLNEQEYSKVSVDINKHGLGHLSLKDLPTGSYSVSLHDESDEEFCCRFTVAEYRLVPLIASILDRKREEADSLRIRLQLESFGNPVDGPVLLRLIDGDVALSSVECQCVDGVAEVVLNLSGNGPHRIDIQLKDDPMKTASVPLTGSRISERTSTIFSSLGKEVTGSLLPGEDSKEVRGIFLDEGAAVTSPLVLESVTADKARFRVKVPRIELLTVVTIDPQQPKRRLTAVIPNTHNHPSRYDDRYRNAEYQFEKENYEVALKLFEEGWNESPNPHPYFAYFAACCNAKLGNRQEALSWIRKCIEDGWNEWQHMRDDEDLKAISDMPEFQLLAAEGVSSRTFENLEADSIIEIPLNRALSLLTLGAFIDGKAWEGWTTVIAPERLTMEIDLPEECKPDSEVEVKIETRDLQGNLRGSSAFLIIKDARLLTGDTPKSRLASRMKSYVSSAQEALHTGWTEEKALSTILSIRAPRYALRENWSLEAEQMSTGSFLPSSAPGAWGAGYNDSWEAPDPGSSQPPMGGFSSRMTLNQQSTEAREGASRGELFGAMNLPAQDMAGGSPMTLAESIRQKIADVENDKRRANFPPAPSSAPRKPAAKRSRKKAELPTAVEKPPQVLYASIVALTDGEATIKLRLPDEMCEYLVQVFACTGEDWSLEEARVLAVRDPFVDLLCPVFARAEERATGILTAGSLEPGMSVRVLHDGEPIYLTRKVSNTEEERAEKFTIDGAHCTFEFICAPGKYEAQLIDADGKVVYRKISTTNEPGKLRRRVISMKLLEQGEMVSLDDENIVSVRVLPSLNESFEMLVDATGDYAHCCCEQTAAKIISGCAMFMLSGQDESRQKKAESIIIAGIKREEKMWLQGRGFKSYPEVPDVPDQYYGVKAARYLTELSSLKGLQQVSSELSKYIDKGLMMARDACTAYSINRGEGEPKSCEEAYFQLRRLESGENSQASRDRLIEFVKSRISSSKEDWARQSHPEFAFIGVKVLKRAESAYAACCLLRGGGQSLRRSALDLANEVIAEFNEQKRLYSTVDSVAAIALMKELQDCRIATGGTMEINGKEMNLDQAQALSEPIHTVKALEGVTTVETTREVIDDWTTYSAGVQMRVALERDGKAASRFKLGDVVDLKVSLIDGYKDGDLVWICLPDALSRLIGGGQVKLFSVDFEGKSGVSIPIAITGRTGEIEQKFAVCLRNMFDEDRAGSPGLLDVTTK